MGCFIPYRNVTVLRYYYYYLLLPELLHVPVLQPSSCRAVFARIYLLYVELVFLSDFLSRSSEKCNTAKKKVNTQITQRIYNRYICTR
jgi:hypothetical protein